MGFRAKLLSVFLLLSIAPLVFLRITNQQTMLRLSHNLGERTREVLLEKASAELLRLVEDHGRVLVREREIIELALGAQASEIERILSLAPGKEQRLSGIEQDLARSFPNRDQGQEGVRSGGEASLNPRQAHGHPVSVENKAGPVREGGQTLWTMVFPAGSGPEEDNASRLAFQSLTPVFQSLKTKFPGIILHQLVALPNRGRAVFPALEDGVDPAPLFQSWLPQVLKQKSPVWTMPYTDAVSGTTVLAAAVPIQARSGPPVGATAIVVPIHVLLHENVHIKNLSPNVVSLLIRSGTGPDGRPTVLEVARGDGAAREIQGGKPRVPAGLRYLDARPAKTLAAMARDITLNASNVQRMVYEGRPRLMAYGRSDDRGTALLLAVPEEDIFREAAEMEAHVVAGFQRQIVATGMIAAFAVSLVILAAFFLSRSFTRDILHVADAFRRLSRGDFSIRLHIRTRDEMRELGEAFNAMVPALEERLHLKKVLDIAKEVQQNLLPQKSPAPPGLDVSGMSIYCEETGGDYYDFFEMPGKSGPVLGVAVGDVSGHGLQGALLMATTRAFLRLRAAMPGSLAEVAADVNRLLARDVGDSGRFATLFLMAVDGRGRTLRWVRAGHDPALLYDPGTDTFDELSGAGVVLGALPDSRYEEGARALLPGQVLAVGTDGIWETRNAAGNMYGMERMRALIRQHAGESAQAMAAAVTEETSSYRGGGCQEDDITLVIIKVLA
jgi:sigma-B regulation protein RsbU (phosphoserine phosphatase)